VQLVYLVFITPVVYDFYHYKMESPQFVQLFTQFSQVFLRKSCLAALNYFIKIAVIKCCDNSVLSVQNLALCGALVFFLGMKSSIPRRYSKRRIAKSKTT
jgi:hypothetical protein